MPTTDYKFRTEPFGHQDTIFHETAELKAYGLFWEQGVAKTKPMIDTAAYLYETGEIDTLVIVAPNGVHHNWITDEIPIHMPLRLREEVCMMYWDTRRSKTQGQKLKTKAVAKHDGLSIFSISYDGMMADSGLKALASIFKNSEVMVVFDESHYAKTPGAARTKRAIALAKRAKYKRILTGTPYANSPFDAYAQARILDPGFWKPHGFDVSTTFQAHFGLFEKRLNMRGKNKKTGKPKVTEYDHCVAYRRLDQLKALMDPITSRLTKDETLDLPPKLYQRRTFDLSAEQTRIYKELKNDAIALLDSGEIVTAPLAITLLLRLQQVTCGYVPTDQGEPITFDKNPRLDLLKQVCEDTPHSAIIWARFRRDIDLIMELLGHNAVRYDGSTTPDERISARQRFQAGDVKFFVGNPAAGGTGITLTKARTVIYYSNSFKLVERLQSEDRAHRPGQEHPVLYIDLIAPGTVDEHIVKALRSKLNIAGELTGDTLREWI